jgi:hypothetical protein
VVVAKTLEVSVMLALVTVDVEAPRRVEVTVWMLVSVAVKLI